MSELLDERIAVNTPTGKRHVPRIEMLLRKLIALDETACSTVVDVGVAVGVEE